MRLRHSVHKRSILCEMCNAILLKPSELRLHQYTKHGIKHPDLLVCVTVIQVWHAMVEMHVSEDFVLQHGMMGFLPCRNSNVTLRGVTTQATTKPTCQPIRGHIAPSRWSPVSSVENQSTQKSVSCLSSAFSNLVLFFPCLFYLSSQLPDIYNTNKRFLLDYIPNSCFFPVFFSLLSSSVLSTISSFYSSCFSFSSFCSSLSFLLFLSSALSCSQFLFFFVLPFFCLLVFLFCPSLSFLSFLLVFLSPTIAMFPTPTVSVTITLASLAGVWSVISSGCMSMANVSSAPSVALPMAQSLSSLTMRTSTCGGRHLCVIYVTTGQICRCSCAVSTFTRLPQGRSDHLVAGKFLAQWIVR